MCYGPSSSDKHTKSSSRTAFSEILIRIVEQCCSVFASSEASELFTDQIHMIKLPDVGSILSSIHVLVQSANFIFAILLTILCGKCDASESVGCALEMCAADDVVSQLQCFPFFLDKPPTS